MIVIVHVVVVVDPVPSVDFVAVDYASTFDIVNAV